MIEAQKLWRLDRSSVYLNHGSFGPPPRAVVLEQRRFKRACDREPMLFFVRQLERFWNAARRELANFVGCLPEDMVFCENATAGMNHIARFFPLQPDDEVLLNDHEYGVVKKIWQRKCREASAVYREMQLPLPVESTSQIVDAFRRAITGRTKLIVVSHITSPTAITLPVKEICRLGREHKIPVCIDGPHAPLQIPLDIQSLDCDFYVASCHKWLSAPFGSGFTYVAPEWQSAASEPLSISWGRLPPMPIETWSDHYVWMGTRDYSSYLAIPAAISFMEKIGIDAIRQRNHQLARYARQAISSALGTEALVPDSEEWYSMMAAIWLPKGDHSELQKHLWMQHGIEVPITRFGDRFLVRVSCHLYNTQPQIDLLVDSIKSYLYSRS